MPRSISQLGVLYTNSKTAEVNFRKLKRKVKHNEKGNSAQDVGSNT